MVPFHLLVLVLSAFLQQTCPKKSILLTLIFLKKKNDMRINNLPDVEYARRSVSLMNRLRSDRNDEASFSIKEKKGGKKTHLGQNVQACFKAGEIFQKKKLTDVLVRL